MPIDHQEGTIEFYIRTSLVLLITKILLSHIILGIFYFTTLSILNLENVGITLSRLTLFTFFEFTQACISLILFLRWFYECYEITEKEIVCHKGVIAKNVDCYSLEKAESVKVKQGIIGALFKFGTLEVTINHSDHRDLVSIRNIPRPRRNSKIIEKALKKF